MPLPTLPDHVRATVSMGLTMLSDGEQLQQAVDRADGLLYQAKEQGRNRVVSDAMDPSGQEKTT